MPPASRLVFMIDLVIFGLPRFLSHPFLSLSPSPLLPWETLAAVLVGCGGWFYFLYSSNNITQPACRGTPEPHLHTWQRGRDTLGMSPLTVLGTMAIVLLRRGQSWVDQCWFLEIVSFHSQKGIGGPRMYRFNSTWVLSVWLFMLHKS